MQPELPVLRDERVLLRRWVLEDAPALRHACGDAAICRFTSVPRSYTAEEARAWIARQYEPPRAETAIVWAIVPAELERPVGMIGVFGLGEEDRSARFGYWLVAEWRGRGLAGAASRLVAAWGFTARGLSAIHIDREPGNTSSARVADRLGAVAVGARQGMYEGAAVELIRHTLTAPGALL